MTASTKVSILMPTYCRQELIPKQLEFWKTHNHFELIVADGSPNDFILEEKELQNTTYFKDHGSYYNRIKRAASLAKSDYVCVLCDDELISPDFLHSAYEFLSKNDSYSVVTGASICFQTVNNKLITLDGYNLKHRVSSNKNSFYRAARHVSEPYYQHNYYGLWRKTDFLHLLASFLPLANSKNPYLLEFLMEVGAEIIGKTTSLPQLHWFRGFDYTPITLESYDRNLDFFTWKKSYPDEYNKFKEIIRNIFENKAGILNKNKSSFYVDRIFDSYSNYLKNLKGFPPKKVYEDIDDHLKVLESEGVKFAKDETLMILRLLYHKQQ